MTTTERITVPEDNTGCWLDNHRGHYIQRDMILLAADSFGYILDPLLRWYLDCYEDHYHEDNYPTDILTEIVDEVEKWLNCGDNEGPDREIKFQNNPPVIPEGHAWGWNDGDYGLYPYVLFNIGQEDSEGHRRLGSELTMPQARRLLTEHGGRKDVIEKLLDQSSDDMALQMGGFIVEAIEF